MSESITAGLEARTGDEAPPHKKNSEATTCEVCNVRTAQGMDGRTGASVCRRCARLRVDGGTLEDGSPEERQADAMERVADEIESQNAVLTEIARTLHMVGVPFDIDAVWLLEGRVERTARLSAWTGLGRATADTVIELPAGAADGIEAGDVIRIDEYRSDRQSLHS